jgi:hypothetical protein
VPVSLTVRVGNGIQIGDHTVIRVEQKGGQRVRLSVETPLGPVVLLDGELAPSRTGALAPVRYTAGLGIKPKRIAEPEPT